MEVLSLKEGCVYRLNIFAFLLKSFDTEWKADRNLERCAQRTEENEC